MSIHVTESLLQKISKKRGRQEGKKEKKERRTSYLQMVSVIKSPHIKLENNINITHIYQKDENVRLLSNSFLWGQPDSYIKGHKKTTR